MNKDYRKGVENYNYWHTNNSGVFLIVAKIILATVVFGSIFYFICLESVK